MFIEDCDNDEVKREASKLLKSLDVKHRFKKLEIKLGDKREGEGVFKIRLEKLRQKKVKLHQYDHPVSIPAFLADSCEYLRDSIDTEGLFRKPGVKVRQRELKKMLLSGGRLTTGCDHNPADVADLLKLFFRELPEPCIPYFFHDILQRCLEVKEKQNDAIFVTLLMLPAEYLYTLAYVMQFLHEVAAHKVNNRMDTSNLAIIWTPNLMPFKAGSVSDKLVLDKRLTIVQMLIEQSRFIGVVPDCLIEHISWQHSLSSHNELELSRHREKKKRRSGSLTRMLSGIRKMVHKSGTEDQQAGQETPEQVSAVPHTPRIMSTGKKRKASESNLLSFSAKKRKDLLELMPQGHLLPDVCGGTTHLTPRVVVAQPARNSNKEESVSKRRSRFYTSSKSSEKEEKFKSGGRSVSGSRLRLSHFGLGRKSKKKAQMMEDSGQELSATPNTLDLTSSSEDYVRISRTEYEEIKNRMSIIESRISSEFENIIGVSMSDLEMTPEPARNSLCTVQSAYQKTLASAEKLNSPTADELARRFSRELKIRGNSEKKVIRSPSARKIGSLRRRSKENVPQVKRNLSLNVPERLNSYNQFYPLNNLRRGKPNTVNNGLPEPLFASSDSIETTKSYLKTLTNHLKLETFESPRQSLGESAGLHLNEFNLSNFGVLTRSQARRASSFHGCDLRKVSTTSTSVKQVETSMADEYMTEWTNAEDFLKDEKMEDKVVTGRPSVARLRSQNAGMVLAKAKMFSTMVEPEKASEERSREIKKRNSSKSSKDRKIQRKDSKNNNRKLRKDNGSGTLSNSETLILPSQKLNGQSIVKENVTVKGALNKTSLSGRKVAQNNLREHLNIKGGSENRVAQIISPLRDRNGPVTPGRALCQQSSKTIGRSPNVVQKEGKATPKALHLTPRKSPRQILLKSRTLSKPYN